MSASNSDSAEINKFTQIAAQWWDIQGPCKPLHIINHLRFEFITTEHSLQGQEVIDIGCGGGILTETLAKQGAKVTGIDKSSALIQVAKKHAEESLLPIKYYLTDAESFAKSHSQSFDVVCCMELLEHVPDPCSLIQACSDLAKPGANIFFSTINRNPRSYLFAILGAEYILKLLPKGTHDYKKFICPSELAKAARKANLILQKFQGIHYNPLTRHYALGKDIRVNYLAAFRKRH
ncbi:MAG: ubiquinone biosynthesis O-methyltransferase [Pseudomonadota bacterium]|jgi:2-polyprenyl-6-hydroxyphenyl methylase / 3-demethylubiquinone-9 3-methyltransferase